MIIIIKNLWKQLPIKRKYQSLLIIFLTTFVAFAEILLLFSFMLMIDNVLNPEKKNFSIILKNNFLNFQNFDLNNINLIFSIFIICVVLTGCLRLFLLWSTIRFSFVSTSDFARKIFFNTVSQPLKYHLNNSSNEMLNGLTKKIQLLCIEIILPF